MRSRPTAATGRPSAASTTSSPRSPSSFPCRTPALRASHTWPEIPPSVTRAHCPACQTPDNGRLRDEWSDDFQPSGTPTPTGTRCPPRARSPMTPPAASGPTSWRPSTPRPRGPCDRRGLLGETAPARPPAQGPPRGRHRVRSGERHRALADGSFDVAFSGRVLQMVRDLDAYLAGARRVLRDEGVLLFDLPHPFYGQFDPETATLERSYHGDPRRTITSSETSVSDPEVFDHTVGELHNAAVRGGSRTGERRPRGLRRGPVAEQPTGPDGDDAAEPAVLGGRQATARYRSWSLRSTARMDGRDTAGDVTRRSRSAPTRSP